MGKGKKQKPKGLNFHNKVYIRLYLCYNSVISNIFSYCGRRYFYNLDQNFKKRKNINHMLISMYH